jgi:hypothetical protein
LNVPVTSSYANNANSASYANNATSASYATTASFSLNVPVTSSYADNANSASYALSASFATTASYLTGYISPFPFTGSAIISGSLTVTGSVAVSNLQGTGVRYLIADDSGSVTAQSASAALKSTEAFTSTAGQTTFAVTNGYSTGYVDVFINGSKLSTAEFTDTSGTNIVLATGSFINDTVEVVKYTPALGVTNNVLRQLTTLTASAAQTVFSASYTPGLLDIFYNGARLTPADFTANNGTYFTLATASAANDILDVLVYSYQVGAFSGIGGVGTATQVAYFDTTNSITGSPNFTISGSTMLITGSLIVSGSGTFTNIGPAVFSGSITSTAGFTGSFSGTATSASYAANADLLDGLDSTVFTLTSSFVAQTASFTAFTSSINSFSASILAQTASLNAFSASVLTFTGSAATRLGALEAATSSLYSYTSSLNNQTASFATTGSNTFIGTQTISGSILQSGSFTTTGTIIAQTINVQQVTSSVIYSSGSNIFGNLISNTQTFTGSVLITGSLAIAGNITSNGTAVVLGSGTSGYLPKFTGASTIGNSLLTDNGTNIGLGVANPTSGRLQINVSDTTTAAHLQIVDGTTTLANSFVTNFRNANDGDGRYSLSRWQVQNAVGNDQNGFIGVQSVTGAGAYTPNIVFGQRTGVSTYATRMTLDASGNLGLGVTPSAWYSSEGYNALQVGNASLFGRNSTNSELYLSSNTFENSSGNPTYITSDFATRYAQNDGVHSWLTAISGTAGCAITFTQAMTLTAAGNLGIGTTTPDIFGRGDARNVGISVVGASDNMALQLNAGGSAGRGAQIYMGQGACRHLTISSNTTESTIGTSTNTPVKFTTADVLRFSICANGVASFACDLTAKTLGTNDLILNNLNYECANYVDGTRGSWLIQEGACDLFIINQVSCKKYKFNLIEIK